MVAVVNAGLEVLQVAGFPEVFGRFRRYLQVVRKVFKRFVSLPPSRRVCRFAGALGTGSGKVGFREPGATQVLALWGMIPLVLGPSSSRC